MSSEELERKKNLVMIKYKQTTEPKKVLMTASLELHKSLKQTYSGTT